MRTFYQQHVRELSDRQNLQPQENPLLKDNESKDEEKEKQEKKSDERWEQYQRKFLTFFELAQQWQPRKPLLSLDVGTTFIGVAITDQRHQRIHPLPTIQRRLNNHAEVFNKILEHVKEYDVQAVVVGIPATHVYTTASVLDYVNKVWGTQPNVELPVVLQDESYSTSEVVRELEGRSEIDHKKIVRELSSQDKRVVDQLSAMKIMERALAELEIAFDLFQKTPVWQATIEQRRKELQGELQEAAATLPPNPHEATRGRGSLAELLKKRDVVSDSRSSAIISKQTVVAKS